MRKFSDLVRQQNGKLAELEAQSMGRPVGTYHDAYICAGAFEYCAALAVNVHGHSSLLTPGRKFCLQVLLDMY